MRAILRRQMRAGSLNPQDVLQAAGWLEDESSDPTQRVMRTALGAALGRPADPEPEVEPEQPAAVTVVKASVTAPSRVNGYREMAKPIPQIDGPAPTLRGDDEALLEQIQAAVESGELANPPTPTSLRSRFSVGKTRADRLARAFEAVPEEGQAR